MKRSTPCLAFLLAALCLLVAPVVAKEKEQLPEVTKDGLHLVKQNKLGAVWAKPGATLSDYSKVILVDCYVAFEKNWQRNYNADHFNLSERVTDKDMQRIKQTVAERFKEEFTKALTDGGYPVVTEAAQDVFIVRPAIINLEVTAPDLMSPNLTRTFVSDAGSLTLYAELYDSVSGAKIAEVLDAEVAGDYGVGRLANRVSNTQALDQVLERWAGILVKRLNEAHGKADK